MIEKAVNTLSVPLVSVIMPTNNSERFVEDTVKSVLGQSYGNIELIVVDDGSTDHTVREVEALAELDSRMILLREEQNSGGPAAPRNLGLRRAKGEFIAFIDSDDIWHESKIATQISAMLDHELNFSSTCYSGFEGDVKLDTGATLPEVQIRRIDHDQLLRKNMIATSSVLMTSELAQSLVFSEDQIYVAVEDYLAWLYLHQLPSIRSGVVLNSLVFYRKRPNSISSSKIAMAIKIFTVLSNYKINGQTLGLRKYGLFITYIYGGLLSTYLSWKNRITA